MFSEGEVEEGRDEKRECALRVVDLATLATEPAVVRLSFDIHTHRHTHTTSTNTRTITPVLQ